MFINRGRFACSAVKGSDCGMVVCVAAAESSPLHQRIVIASHESPSSMLTVATFPFALTVERWLN